MVTRPEVKRNRGNKQNELRLQRESGGKLVFEADEEELLRLKCLSEH